MHFFSSDEQEPAYCTQKSAPAEVTHCFTAVVMISLLGKCWPCSPSFIGLNRWKSDGAKFRLYGRCGRKVQSRWAVRSMVFNWYAGWHYHVARERLPSLAQLWKFEPSSYSASQCSGQIWWFVWVLGNPEGPPLSYANRQRTSICFWSSSYITCHIFGYVVWQGEKGWTIFWPNCRIFSPIFLAK